jgi:hypothetical protein
MNNPPSVYQCDVCKRSIRVPTNKQGITVIRRCIITENCRGTLHLSTTVTDPYSVSPFPPEVTGLNDWTPRNALINFTQGIPSATWTITHNMGTVPSVYAYTFETSPQGDVSYTEIFPTSTTTVDANTTVLTFSTAYTGVAQCVATSTQSTLVSTTVPVTPAATTIQVSNKLVLTFATLDTNITYPIQFTITPASGNPVTATFELTTAPATQSPWSNASTVIVNGKQYTVRPLPILGSTTGQLLLANNTIGNGAGFACNIASYGAVLLLLGSAPFTTADQITTKYIDAASLTATNALFYNNGELYADASYQRNVFPPIIRG